MRDRKRPCFCSFWINSRISAGGKTAFFTLFPAPLLCYDGTQQGNEDLEGFALKLLHAGQCFASQSRATRARISFRHLWKRACSPLRFCRRKTSVPRTLCAPKLCLHHAFARRAAGQGALAGVLETASPRAFPNHIIRKAGGKKAFSGREPAFRNRKDVQLCFVL